MTIPLKSSFIQFESTNLNLVLARLFRAQLFQFDALDPMIVWTGVCLLLLSAALATSIPALRAASIDPIKALKYD